MKVNVEDLDKFERDVRKQTIESILEVIDGLNPFVYSDFQKKELKSKIKELE